MRTTEHIIVTTGDLREDYNIIGPVHFQVCTASSLFEDPFSDLVSQYRKEFISAEGGELPLVNDQRDWGRAYAQTSLKGKDADAAFFIAVEELKKRALTLDADAIVHMRQEINLLVGSSYYFYIQMYGTAVRLTQRPDRILAEPEAPAPKDASAMVTCPICKSKNMPRRTVCWKCGHPIADGFR
ncbi:MAG: heavy metal-binding domain-containing protein [Bacillota bacterium]